MPKPDDFTSTLGERIKWIIREKRLKQSEFAKSLGISANYVYLLTSGKKKAISEPLALMIEKIYDYPAEWIMTGRLPVESHISGSLKDETIRQIKRLNYQELMTVAEFIKSLESHKQ